MLLYQHKEKSVLKPLSKGRPVTKSIVQQGKDSVGIGKGANAPRDGLVEALAH